MKQGLSRARVGLLIFIGVLAFVIGVFTVGEKSQLFSSTFEVHVNFSAAEGVKTGSQVVLSGYAIGTVTDIRLSDNADSVRLTLKVSEEVHPFVKVDSKAEIKQEGLVGNKIINIMIGSEKAKPVEPGGYIQGIPPFALTSLADNVTAITDTTKKITGVVYDMLLDMREGKGSVGKLLMDDGLYNNLVSITARTDSSLTLMVDKINRLTDNLESITSSVDRLVVNADTAMQEVNALAAESRELVDKLNSGKGTIGALISDRELYDSLVVLIDALTDVTYDASNVTNQAAQSIYSMRDHWLLGRFMGGEEAEREGPPVPAYREKMKKLDRMLMELQRRQEQIEARERELGIAPGKAKPAK